MRWHYRLGHLSFAKLKLLAKHGEIPCRLAKVPAPKCVGCLFGAMTKLPWQGKESKSSHKVLVATRPGECVSINHLISTMWDFFPIKKQTHLQAVPRRINLRRPLLSSAVRASDARLIVRRNNKSKRCIRAVCCQTRRCNQALPLQQWPFCGQCFLTSMSTKLPATHFLQGQHPFPKWDRQTCNLGPLREHPKADIACSPALACRSAYSPVAIRPKERGTAAQHRANAGVWLIPAGAFQLNSSWGQNGT